MNKNENLRRLPKMDALLSDKRAEQLIQEHGRIRVLDAVRSEIECLRKRVIAGQGLDSIDIWPEVAKRLGQKTQLRRVINASGILLHTNLGRALMAKEAAAAAFNAALFYSDLEFNLSDGKRGSRLDNVQSILCRLFSCEAALVVNNNAAAVLLMLSSLAKGREVIVSRGELVEIGGSFRIPEVMEQSSCILKEVGATNKTHFRDYENAINENSAALLKVHTSNYTIQGFTEDVSIAELRQLADRAKLPLLYDIGSGAILSLTKYGLKDEPLVKKSLEDGADIVTFSGDKLLSGPQAGIVVGKAEYIEKMKRHPLYRALRVDKMCLAALEKTLEIYLDEDRARESLPLYKMLSCAVDVLKDRADMITGELNDERVKAISLASLCGGGSCPLEEFPSFGLEIRVNNAEDFLRALRDLPLPIIARINEGRILLDLRTVLEEETRELVKGLKFVLEGAL